MSFLLTQALCQLDDEARPCGYASGCIVTHRGVRILITVSHAVGNNGSWALETQWEPLSKRVQLFRFGPVGFIRRVTLKVAKTKVADVDFAYARIPDFVRPRLQKLSSAGVVIHEVEKKDCALADIVSPDANERYAFWGATEPSFYAGNLTRTIKEETEMRYVGRSGDDLLEFQTVEPYRSYKPYQGCSGGPITDSQGRLVALVVEGNKRKTSILGLDLMRYRAVIELQSDPNFPS